MMMFFLRNLYKIPGVVRQFGRDPSVQRCLLQKFVVLGQKTLQVYDSETKDQKDAQARLVLAQMQLEFTDLQKIVQILNNRARGQLDSHGVAGLEQQIFALPPVKKTARRRNYWANRSTCFLFGYTSFVAVSAILVFVLIQPSPRAAFVYT
jgi:hypothetical protein